VTNSLINETTTVSQAANVAAADMDGEVVMLRLETGKYYGLGSVGSRIWKLIAQPCRIAEVIDKLAVEYEVTRTTCVIDTIKFLRHLAAEGLISVN